MTNNSYTAVIAHKTSGDMFAARISASDNYIQAMSVPLSYKETKAPLESYELEPLDESVSLDEYRVIRDYDTTKCNACDEEIDITPGAGDYHPVTSPIGVLDLCDRCAKRYVHYKAEHYTFTLADFRADCAD